MLAAQVNTCKYDQLRIIFGSVWIWGLGLCEALLGWLLIAAAVAGRAFGLFWTEDPPPLCVLAGAVGPHCIVFGSVVGWELAALHSCSVLLVGL
jgi:hypothetical protein